MEEQKRSSMILFLSKYSDKAQKDTYFYDETKGGFEGEQTNDAPSKCLIRIAKESHNPIDTIICIVSQKVFTERKAPGNQTAFERFKDMVLKHCSAIYGDDYKTKIKILPIGYDFEVPTKFEKGEKYDGDGSDLKSLPESKERSVNIYRKIEEKLGLNVSSENKVEHSIYIDYTGGLRDSSFFMVALIRYLEFKDIECKDIIYSDFFSKPKEIRNIRYIYDMFDMINGVSEFVGTGNARQLIKLQEKLEGGAMSDNVKDFVGSLQSFSAAIALCRVDDIEKSIEEITDNIKNLEDDTTQDIFVQMFKTLIPTVKEKLYIDKASHSILDLAQWCLENNMLQQAVTIYNERILFYYYENYDKFREILENGKAYHISKKDAKDLWEDFNKSIKKTLDLEKEANSEVKKVYNKYSKEVEENSENLNCIIKDIKSKHSKVWYALEARYKSLNNNEKQTDMMEFLKNFFGKNTTEFGKVIGKYQKISGVTAGIEYLETQDLQLWNAIKYYHAVKIIRNNINHVSDGTSDMNGRMREYLEKKGLGKTTDTFKFDELTKDFISNILKVAIDCSREVCKKPNTP